jgi:phage-related minor tail protein
VGTPQNPGKARILAKQIADKVSKLDALTDQDGIVDVFRNLKLAVDVAKLADAYRMMYGGNLGTSLKGWLNPTVGKNRLPDLYEVLKRLE